MPPLMNTSPGVVFMSGGITYDGHISKPSITELKDEMEGKKTSLLAQMYDCNRILVMLPIMWLNIS